MKKQETNRTTYIHIRIQAPALPIKALKHATASAPTHVVVALTHSLTARGGIDVGKNAETATMQLEQHTRRSTLILSVVLDTRTPASPSDSPAFPLPTSLCASFRLIRLPLRVWWRVRRQAQRLTAGERLVGSLLLPAVSVEPAVAQYHVRPYYRSYTRDGVCQFFGDHEAGEPPLVMHELTFVRMIPRRH